MFRFEILFPNTISEGGQTKNVSGNKVLKRSLMQTFADQRTFQNFFMNPGRASNIFNVSRNIKTIQIFIFKTFPWFLKS